MFSAELQVESSIREITEDCARSGILASAAPIKQCVPDDISPHKHCVKDMIYTGKDVRIGDQGRINGYLDARAAPMRLF